MLEPIFEADLQPEQYAYRPDRSALDAVRQVHKLLNTGHGEVVDADLSGYFDSIPHSELRTSVARRIVDGAAEYSTQAATPGTTYIHTDMLGSTRMVSNASGTILECYDYMPFGRMLRDADNARTNCYPPSPDAQITSNLSQKFTGKERDAETRLDFFGARYYSAAQGRFTGPDPFSILEEAESEDEIAEYLAEPQRWNKYAYSLNNPFKYVDPDGKNPQLLQRLMQILSPYANRFGAAVSNLGRAVLLRAGPVASSPAAQEIGTATIEMAAGYEGPSFSPIRAAEKLGVRNAIDHGVGIAGRLANRAEVATILGKKGDDLSVNILGLYNPTDSKGLNSLGDLLGGALKLARDEGAKTLTIRAVAVGNERLLKIFDKRWKKIRLMLPDQTEVDAFEQTFDVD